MGARMRLTRSKTGSRRSNHGLVEPRVSTCPNCQAPQLRHRACTECGQYRGRVVLDVARKAEKKAVKAEARQREMGEATPEREGDTKTPEESSK
ncbi:MAG: 50S ribosomal protein L32 [Candidatus Pacebacteria bacterium]|nr:50S ribosomal protein L32 [Candidatus Paceibacterota bacterium]